MMNINLKIGIIITLVSLGLWGFLFLLDLILSAVSDMASALISAICCFVIPLIFLTGLIFILIGLLSGNKKNRPPQRYNPPPRPQQQPMQKPMHNPPPPPNKMLIKAQNFEKAERWEDAAKIYEQLDLWEEAGRCRRRAKGSTIKHVHVNANDLFKQIRTEGLAVNYKCNSCGGHLDIDGSKRLKYCTSCGSPIDTETLSKLVNSLLE
jgi:hypothetical protein